VKSERLDVRKHYSNALVTMYRLSGSALKLTLTQLLELFNIVFIQTAIISE
jgi:hypothetical protein